MKNFSTMVLMLFTAMTVSAQALLTINKTSEGVYKMTYNDAANSWAFYNPQSQPIGVYLFLNPGDTTPSGTFNDAWSNITTTLTWDGTNYSGTIDLNTHNFNNSGGILPVGTTVNELRFLFTEAPAGNGSHQTSDKQATSYGFTPSTISTLGVYNPVGKQKSIVVGGQLFTSVKGDLQLAVYEMSGKLIKTMNVKADGNAIDLNVASTGLYLLKITNGSQNEIVKFAH